MTSAEQIEEINLSKYWDVLRRHWLPATVAFSLAVGLSLLYATSRKSMYEAQSKILVKVDRSAILTGLNAELGQIGTLEFDGNPLNTQAEVIQSESLLSEVVNQINNQSGRDDQVSLASIEKHLSVKNITNTDLLLISYQSEDPKLAADIVNTVSEAYVRYNIVANRAEAVAAKQFIDQEILKSADTLQQAETRLRKFKETYQAFQQEGNSYLSALGSLQTRIDQARLDIAKLDTQIQAIQSQVNIENLDLGATIVALNQSAGVQQALTEFQTLETEMARQQSLFREQNPTIITLKQQQENLGNILDERIRQVIHENSASVSNSPNQTLDNLQLGEFEISSLVDLITLDRQRKSLITETNELTALKGKYQDTTNRLPQLEQIQGELERNLNIAQSNYQGLTSKIQEIEIAENQNIGNASIISTANIPDYPLGSNKKLILAAGIFSGSLLAISIAFFLDLIDKKIRTKEELEEIFSSKILAEIPRTRIPLDNQISSSQDIASQVPQVAVRDASSSNAVEAYEFLQLRLCHLATEKNIRKLLVTSPERSDGKSTVAANLALAIAQSGKNVLIVDANLRNPVQHLVWNNCGKLGIKEIITENFELEKLMSSVEPNLHVLSSGHPVSNPTSLLKTDAMPTLLDSLEQKFDFIIIDSPSLLEGVDASILGRLADGVLLVTHLGQLNRNQGEKVRDLSNQFNHRILGVVINAV